MARTAVDYGFDGIVVRNHGDEPADYDPARIEAEYGIDVVDGVEIRADEPSRASGYVGNHRSERALVLVHGGSESINRFAVEQPQVDVLAHPLADGGDFNHVLAKAAAKNGVRIEFSLGPVLRQAGGSRVKALDSLRKLREIVTTYDVPYVVSADPASHLALRAPRELLAVGELIGFSRDEIETGLAEWHVLAERNARRQSESFIEPGVERGSYEENN
jgi:ribonuclease P/MRP protein subunit RPP1